MNWRLLSDEGKLSGIVEESTEKFVLIFKHSARCSTSALAINRLERDWKDEVMDVFIPYFLDILSYRNLSNHISLKFGVQHESPQVLVIRNGNCIYHESHLGIIYSQIEKLKDKISV